MGYKTGNRERKMHPVRWKLLENGSVLEIRACKMKHSIKTTRFRQVWPKEGNLMVFVYQSMTTVKITERTAAAVTQKQDYRAER